ncbi:MAG: hypothetical protein R2747_09015 [Pyrinomonadaceae bacterium]
MDINETTYLTKLRWNLPWLVRYPFLRAGTFFRPGAEGEKHLIFTVADHFEPSWKAEGGLLPLDEQRRKLDDYHRLARKTGEAVRDADGTKFRHTNFFPAEQYDPDLLDTMAAMQAEGLGEVEIHLHHGVEKPDTPANTRRVLTEFRDALAERHRCLSRLNGEGEPKYAFVHGNLALANSAGGRFCGVDEEMEILAETGCYADMTMPSAPDITQVPMLNQIYECSLPLSEKIPHRKGNRVEVGRSDPQLPLIFTGPLVFNWTRRIRGLPVPRLEDGALVDNQPMDLARLRRWVSADVTVKGRPEWVFIKLYCHGFFAHDQAASIGEKAERFFSDVIEQGEKTGEYKVYFASAREAFNMAAAAIDGREGNPGEFRDYLLKPIMCEN